MYLKMHKYMVWHYRACQPSDTASHVLPPSLLQVEEPSSIWWFLVFPVSPWWPSVAMAVRVCSDPARLPRWFTAQSGTSLPFSGCPEQESSHAMGHPKNAVQMAATQQLATHPASVWFTGADTANLFHYHTIISEDTSPVIRILLFTCCPFAVFLLRGRRSTPIMGFFSCWKPLQSQILQQEKCDWEQKRCLKWH